MLTTSKERECAKDLNERFFPERVTEIDSVSDRKTKSIHEPLLIQSTCRPHEALLQTAPGTRKKSNSKRLVRLRIVTAEIAVNCGFSQGLSSQLTRFRYCV